METGATAGGRGWLRGGDAVLAAALVMIAAQLVWKFDLVRRTYFRQDDFMFLARGLENGFTWDYLMRVDFGHLTPGAFAVHWAMGRLGGHNDALAHALTIGLQAAAGLALLRLLWVLFGPRPAVLVPLGFALVTPMTIPGLSWWAVVAETLPYQVALPMALASHVLHVRTGRFRHAVAAAAWTVFGMLFFVKAPFIPVLALVLTLGWLGRPRTRRVWALYLAVLVPYAVLFLHQLLTSVQLTKQTSPISLPSAEVAAKSVWTLLTGSLVPTSLGGPWRWQPIGQDYALAATPAPLAWASLAVAAAAVTVSVLWRRRAWLAWTALLGYFLLADVAPIMLGRIELLGPDLSGYELRYVSSTAVVVALVLGLAFIPVLGEQRPWRRPAIRGRWVWAPLAGAVVASSVWSVAAYADRPLGREVRSYVETAETALARVPKGTVVLDTFVPDKVAFPLFFYDYARHSKVVDPDGSSGVTWTRRLNGPMTTPLIFDGQGRLRPVRLDGITLPTGDDCGSIGQDDVMFMLPDQLKNAEYTVQISYLNGAPSELSVRLGLTQTKVPAGAHLGVTYATLYGGGSELYLRTVGSGRTCVGEIRIGVPVADGTAAAVPPQPVER
ncbi:hypothetical protein MF672_045695 [Actinomadura sp. ATCC 31491]|uniref:Glycosyltransferase RgtA/B/C/D-like domain-containing protein n=1 Tax=Actinomadura luzonensis TaxID=2805427 RepID=A0ABT0G8W9_9ACTN|nr:hypothetical protein [Actinomadura luzonensis]MCK2221050.1 hypothetical protein [Actinomadura luzonensis]